MEAKPEQVSHWILEFLLRNPNLETLAKRSLAVLPVAGDDARLKKIVLLRTIECEITDGLVTESTLTALELLEELDSRRGLHVADAMKAAYAAVAVELTVRFLVGGGGKPEVKYLGALQRIWRVRVRALEEGSGERRSELLSGELRRWWDEVEAAVWDDGACARLMGLNTRNDAVLAVKAYLKEAWVLVGKMFVIYGVRLRNEEGENGVGVAREENEPPDKGMSLIGLVELTKKMDFHDCDGGDGDGVCDRDVVLLPDSVGVVANDTPLSSDKEIRIGKEVQRIRHSAAALRKRPRGPVRITDVEDKEADILKEKYSIPTHVVNKVQEALRSSSTELTNAVTDPLPEAVQVAETIISELTTKNVIHENGLATDAENVAVDKSGEQVQSHDADLGKPISNQQNDGSRAVHSDANLGKPSCSHHNDVPPPHVASDDANIGEPSCSHQNVARRPGLMERNSTAHTFQWDESDDTPQAMGRGRNRLHLPSPKKRKISPLKKYEPSKASKRRPVKRWTLLEEDALRSGVEKCGRGNWKQILESNRDIFEGRTEVDLKDKWRNLMK